MNTNSFEIADLHGKVCLVTGATSGIGLETALALARAGAHVVAVGRSRERGRAALERIHGEVPGASVELLLADLSVQAQVRALAEQFLRRHARLDVLVNNAGGFFMRRQESADGLELTFALNHLSYFLLTRLLLERLQASAPARVVNVSSDAHQGVQGLPWDDLQLRRHYAGFQAYSYSKLANVLFTFELARRLDPRSPSPTRLAPLASSPSGGQALGGAGAQGDSGAPGAGRGLRPERGGTGVTANALHPGFTATGFGRNNGPLMDAAMRVVGLFARSPAQGAQTAIYLAASPAVEAASGRYFADCREKPASPAAQDASAAGLLWKVSEALTGLDQL